jgi:SAM-dependent methyltransferase
MDNIGLAKFYDQQPDYAAFRNDPAKREYYEIVVDWKARELVRLLPDNFFAGNILEVGCAFGVLLNNIADRIHIDSRTGVDISGENIKTAKINWPGCNFFKGTIEEFKKEIPAGIQNKRYDLVVLSDIVEHIPDDFGFLKTVKSLSSYLLLNLPLEKSFSTRNRFYGESDPSGHLRCYNKADAVKLLTMAGFEVVTSFTSVAFFDKKVHEIYTKNRELRVNLKPLPLRAFWTLFYIIEDKIKLSGKRFYEKIYGTNYFALLKSSY